MPSFLSDNNTPNRNDPEWVILQKILGSLNTISGGGSGGGPFVEVSGDTMTGPLVNSTNGALSTPVISVTGTPITGGSTSTTAPLVKIGSGTDSEYSTSGCLLALNAPNSFAGYIQQWLVNGSQRVVIDSVSGTAGRISLSRRSSSTLTGTIHGVDYAGTGDGLQLNFSGGSTSRLALENGQVQVNGNFLVQSTNTIGWSDLFLRRSAAANLAFGAADAASPVAQTISVQNVVTGTSNTAGATFTRNCSLGTGTGGSGDDVIKQGITGSSGTTVNTAGTRVYRRAKETTLTEATATKLFTVPLAAGGYIGITIDATVFASDGTDFQCQTSVLNVNAVAKSTTITGTITQVDGTVASSSGTLTPVTFTVVDDGSNVLSVKCAATSSLVQTTLSCKWTIRNINSNVSATITPL